MSKYTVSPGYGGVGFDIAVISGNGARNTLLGFATELEAQAWIMRDRRLNDHTDPFMPQLIMLRRDSAVEYPEMLVSQQLTAGSDAERRDRMAWPRLPSG
jgi:hypothetical protein